MELERILANTMRDCVLSVVYDYYEPKEYERRGDDGGLSDTRNMIVSDVTILGDGKVKLSFENITEGNDTLIEDFTVDTIEEGIKSNWMNPNGRWTDKRPFVEETANRLRQNPVEMIAAIKSGLVSQGFTVR